MDRTIDYNSRFVLSEGLALLARPKLDEGGRESLALSEVERVERSAFPIQPNCSNVSADHSLLTSHHLFVIRYSSFACRAEALAKAGASSFSVRHRPEPDSPIDGSAACNASPV
jgi:hypothetical protein